MTVSKTNSPCLLACSGGLTVDADHPSVAHHRSIPVVVDTCARHAQGVTLAPDSSLGDSLSSF